MDKKISIIASLALLALLTGAGAVATAIPIAEPRLLSPLEERVRTHDEGSTHETRGGHPEGPGESIGGGGEMLEVTLHVVESGGLAFDQDVIEIPAGQRVMVILVNDGKLEHDFEVAQLPVEQVEAGKKMEGSSQMGDMHHKEGIVAAHAMSGMKASVMFTPLQTGEYEFYCTIPGHKEAGMVGKLVVHP